MLETVLKTLHNWFEIRGAARAGTFSIVSGALELDFMQGGQYYRIEGSVFNDGLHRYGDEEDNLTDETFVGLITPLAIPKAVKDLAQEIEEYCTKNPETDKVSESFGGYSYTRGTDGKGSVNSGWKVAFRDRLNLWKKVC